MDKNHLPARQLIQVWTITASLAAIRKSSPQLDTANLRLTDSHRREGVNGRALPNGVAVTGGKATVALCVAACKAAGFSMAGIEYANECCKFDKNSEMNLKLQN
jgi:hypothetical protein